jgi:hypothetical protein
MIKTLKKKIREFICNRRSNIDNKIKSKSFLKKNDLTFYINTFGSKNPNKKFYVIQRTVGGGGMFSNLNYVIHHMKIALDLKCIPVIDMKNFPTKYNEKYKINNSLNSWDYYFYPINKYKLEEVYKSKFVIFVDGKTKRNIEFDSFEHLGKAHIQIYKKYIKIKKEITDEATSFINKNFSKGRVLGVHFRGTDMKTQERHPFPPTANQIIRIIDQQIKKFKYNRIYLVTEDLKNLSILKKYYHSKILFFNNSFRSNKTNIFEQDSRKNHRYLLGKENIIDMLILAKTDKIICSNSHLPDASNFISYPKKIKFIKIDNGNNSENILFAQFFWYLKKNLPEFLGGFKN